MLLTSLNRRRVLITRALATACILQFSLPSKTLAIEPATITAGAMAVDYLFRKPTPDVGLQLSMANRELLLGAHTRLAEIESGLAKILQNMDRLPQEIYDGNLRALQYEYGVDVDAEIDLALARYKLYKRQSAESRRASMASEFASDAEELQESFYKLSNQSRFAAVNTLSTISALYAEFAIRSLLAEEFGIDSQSDMLVIRAEEAQAVLNKLVDRSYAPGLLPLQESMRERIAEFTWADGFSFEVPVSGSYTGQCFAARVRGSRQGECAEWVNMGGIPELPNMTCVSYEQIPTVSELGSRTLQIQLKHGVDFPGPYAIPDLVVEAVDTSQCDGSEIEVTGWDDQVYLNYVNTLEHETKLTETALAIYLNAGRFIESVHIALDRFGTLDAGNLTEFTLDDSSLLSTGDFDSLLNDLVAFDVDSQAIDTALFENQQATIRSEIDSMIEEQDQQLNRLFQDAAEAASNNAQLDLLHQAAKLYSFGYKNFYYLTDEQRAAYSTASRGIASEISSHQMLGDTPLSAALDQFHWWAGLSTMKRVNQMVEQRAIALQYSIAPGVTADFEVYWFPESDTVHFIESGTPSLLPERRDYLGKRTICGRKGSNPWERIGNCGN